MNEVVNQRVAATFGQTGAEFGRVLVFEQSMGQIVMQVQQQHQDYVDRMEFFWKKNAGGGVLETAPWADRPGKIPSRPAISYSIFNTIGHVSEQVPETRSNFRNYPLATTKSRSGNWSEFPETSLVSGTTLSISGTAFEFPENLIISGTAPAQHMGKHRPHPIDAKNIDMVIN